jgi:hypothetical protein
VATTAAGSSQVAQDPPESLAASRPTPANRLGRSGAVPSPVVGAFAMVGGIAGRTVGRSLAVTRLGGRTVGALRSSGPGAAGSRTRGWPWDGLWGWTDGGTWGGC